MATTQMKARIKTFNEEKACAEQKGYVILPSTTGPYVYCNSTGRVIATYGTKEYRKAVS